MSGSDVKAPGRGARTRRKRSDKRQILTGADDALDEFQNSTWSPPAHPVPVNNTRRIFELPQSSKSADSNNHKSGKDQNKKTNTSESLTNKRKSLHNGSITSSSSSSSTAKPRKTSKHQYSHSAMPGKKAAQKWKSRTSDPSTKDVEALRDRVHDQNGKQLIIKINHEHKTQVESKKKKKKNKHKNKSKNNNNKKNEAKNGAMNENEEQMIGDILIHVSSWNQLIAKQRQEAHTEGKLLKGVGWKTVSCMLDAQKLQFWDVASSTKHTTQKIFTFNDNDDDDVKSARDNKTDRVTIYLSEILALNKSIRAIDSEKFIIELTLCGLKCLLSFSNADQREYWHSVLHDYHFNYFIWGSTPLDEEKRRSQHVMHAVHKVLHAKQQQMSSKEMEEYTLNIVYIEEILEKITALNMPRIVELVPIECRFMSGRLVRVISSIKFFLMSVLKSLSGADVALPSRQSLMHYLDEIAHIEWQHTTQEVLDFYCDQCYRILFNLSFAFTCNARDEIMKLNDYIENGHEHKQKPKEKKKEKPKTKRRNDYELDEAQMIDHQRKIAEMKFEYESLQRSWKMHRDRLQEYVMAYRDAVAKLKHSYHQRDNLCKKIETLQQEKRHLTESLQIAAANNSHNNNNNNSNFHAPAAYPPSYMNGGPPPPGMFAPHTQQIYAANGQSQSGAYNQTTTNPHNGNGPPPTQYTWI